MKKHLLLLSFSCLLLSCSQSNQDTAGEATDETEIQGQSESTGAATGEAQSSAPHPQSQKMLLVDIVALEAVVYVGDFYVRKDAEEKAKELDKLYKQYIANFPRDNAKTPEFMFKRAGFARSDNRPLDAIKLYEQIQVQFPEHSQNPQSAFLEAFVYDEDIKDKDRAKEAYQEVINKYPGDYWAKHAQKRLETIDMSDEELVKSFKEKNNK